MDVTKKLSFKSISNISDSIIYFIYFYFSVLRIGLGVCLCVCYSAIFTKTNRIYRIFSGCMKGNQKPAYISPKSQLAICSGEKNTELWHANLNFQSTLNNHCFFKSWVLWQEYFNLANWSFVIRVKHYLIISVFL